MQYIKFSKVTSESSKNRVIIIQQSFFFIYKSRLSENSYYRYNDKILRRGNELLYCVVILKHFKKQEHSYKLMGHKCDQRAPSKLKRHLSLCDRFILCKK